MAAKFLALTGVLFLALATGRAWAQVAVPDLIPAAPDLLLPQRTSVYSNHLTLDNPAALAWALPSRVAAGLVSGSDTNRATPYRRTFGGQFVGTQLVGPRWGFAAEATSIGYQAGGGLEHSDQSAVVQLSRGIGAALSFGAGLGHLESSLAMTDISRAEVGVAAEMGNLVYVGIGLYRDKVASAGARRYRNGELLGAALRVKAGWTYQAAYDWIQLNDFDNLQVGGETMGRLRLELQARSLLVGASQAGVDLHGSPDIWHRAFDIGWAWSPALIVSVRYQQADTQTAMDRSVHSDSLTATWQF